MLIHDPLSPQRGPVSTTLTGPFFLSFASASAGGPVLYLSPLSLLSLPPKSFIFKRFPIIHIAWCYHKIEQFSLLVAYQVEFESKEPAHGAFASLCDSRESLVNMNPLILAYCTIHKTDTCTLAK